MLFAGCRFHLHPGALGKGRRAVFERQIRAHGGLLEEGASTVLLEDALSDSDGVRRAAEKLMAKRRGEALVVIGLSWVSKCLEEGRAVPREGFVIATSGQQASARSKAVKRKAQGDEEKTKKEAPFTSTEASYVERNKHKFVCARSSGAVDEASSSAADSKNPNKDVTNELEKLAAAYKSSNDSWRRGKCLVVQCLARCCYVVQYFHLGFLPQGLWLPESHIRFKEAST